MEKKKSAKINDGITVFGASLGAAFGAASGAVFDSIDMGMGVGMGIVAGTVIALLFGRQIVRFFGNPDNTH